MRLAGVLDRDLPATAAALAEGAINTEQVAVIAPAIANLPAAYRAAGEAHLVNEAKAFGPKALGRLGHRLLEALDPAEAERRDLAAMAKAEARAHRERTLSLTDIPGTGQVRLTGWLDHPGAAAVRAALEPLCAPRTSHRPTGVAGGDGSAVRDERDAGQRRADALVEICRLALTTTDLPDNGGDRPQVVITMNLDDLRDDLGAATFDDGTQMTASTARRMACDAALIPAVLNGKGQVLDLGRERRLFTGPIRRALVLRDQGCAFPACDRPPRWTDGHHITHWSNGGTTDLANAVLLCYHHHREIHTTEWQVRINPTDGLPEFIPPPHLDPERKPRRNRYHRRQ